MTQTVAEYLVEMMVAAGVRNIYGIVGDSANPVVDAIHRSAGRLNFVNVRNEEAGAFAAGADAQISGRPAAVLGSSGPGALHLLNGLYDCARNGAPVFAIATHIPLTEVGTQYFQETRPELIFLDCCRYIGYVSSPAQMPRLAELAMQAAILERGVGMIILPGDICAAKMTHPMLAHPIISTRPVVRPGDADLDRVVDLVDAAKKVMIYAGAGCAGARAEVLALAGKIAAPIGYTFRGKDILEADNAYAVGMTGLLGWGAATAALAECDLLLMLGTDFPYHQFLPSHAKVVQIDDQALHLGRRAKVDIGLVGDISHSLQALLPRLRTHVEQDFLQSMQQLQGKLVAKLATHVIHPMDGAGLRPESVASAISTLAADDAVFTLDTGMCNVWGARYLVMKPGQRILASFGHGSMANALPQAMGAACADPMRQVIALCGDGGLSMLMGELLTVVERGLPVKLMVFNNSTRGMVRAEMEVAGFEPWGTDVINPDFGAVARAIGLHGERVEKPEDIAAAIARALAHPGPALIDFVTDPRALAMPPQETLEELRGFALAMTHMVFDGNRNEVVETVKSNYRDL